MTDLADLVEPLKRYVAVPGTFDDVFPDTTDDDLVGSLLDGFAECQLDGYFTQPAYTADDDGTVSPELSRGQGALILLYTSVRLITAQLTNFQTLQRYRAGNVEYETQQSAQLLVTVLKDLQTRKTDISTKQRTLGAGMVFEMADQYLVRQVASYTPLALQPHVNAYGF